MILGLYGSNNNVNMGYPVSGVTRISPAYNNLNTSSAQNVSRTECQTCNSRKYVDGSNEGNVSFKAPSHIDPGASAAVVSAHEQEHVSNAVKEGNKPGNQLLSASVSLKMSVCPECGRSYVAGGVTSTTIKYSEGNPYEASRKTIEGSFLRGMNFDKVA